MDEIVVQAQRFAGTGDGVAKIEIVTAEGHKLIVIDERKLGGLFAIVCTAIAALAEQRVGRVQTVVMEPQGWRLSELASGRVGVTFLLDGMELTFAVPMSQIEGAQTTLDYLYRRLQPTVKH